MKELIVITHPDMLPGEAGIINQLFTHGLMRLHVRKPEADEAGLGALLEGIDPQFRGRIALHQHHGLAAAFGITGLHFTESARAAHSQEALKMLKKNGFVISTSLHDPADLAQLSHCFDYTFLGPVFDSISKEGYRSKLPAGFKLDKYGFPKKVIALGGVHAENLKSVSDMGFDGAAVLGSIWQNPENAVARFEDLKSLQPSSSLPSFQPKTKAVHCPGFQPGEPEKSDRAVAIDRFHFISNETGTMSHILSIRLALEAGCRWVQLRVKNRAEEEVLPIAREAKELCARYGAKLIINDFPNVALAIGADGLHLGLTDMPVPDARALVGEQMVIGGTANTWDDIALRVDEGADYIGLGPFRFTHTKQNLSPILGIEGYGTLMREMQKAGHSTPIIAIGGITPGDIAGLRMAGLHGIAMSGALIGADNPQNTFYQIQQALC